MKQLIRMAMAAACLACAATPAAAQPGWRDHADWKAEKHAEKWERKADKRAFKAERRWAKHERQAAKRWRKHHWRDGY